LFLVSLLGYGVAVHPCTIMLKRALYSIGKEEEEESAPQFPLSFPHKQEAPAP